MKECAVIVGASSGLGRALAEHISEKGVDLILIAREARDLHAVANNIKIRYDVNVVTFALDIASLDNIKAKDFVDGCCKKVTIINQVYFTAGMVSERDNTIFSGEVLKTIMETNFSGIALLATYFSEYLQHKKSTLAVISSIAAIRPRSMNIAYSSSKIAMEYFIKGLQHNYEESLINFQIYRVGYMDTQMSFGKKLLFPVASVDKVAACIFKNRCRRKTTFYYPGFWIFIAIIIKLLPWFVYKKLKF